MACERHEIHPLPYGVIGGSLFAPIDLGYPRQAHPREKDRTRHANDEWLQHLHSLCLCQCAYRKGKDRRPGASKCRGKPNRSNMQVTRKELRDHDHGAWKQWS